MKKSLINIMLIVLTIISFFSTFSFAVSNNPQNSNELILAETESIQFLKEDLETGTKSLDTFYYKEDSDTVIEGYVPEDAIAPITIFGEDDRMFTSTWNLPFSAICYVVAYYPDGSRSMGSGFLVDDNVMVTCAHIAKGAISIDVMPGKFGDTDRFGKT